MPRGVYVRTKRLFVPLETRFWTHVRKTEACWIWTGGHGQDGYGRTSLDGPSPNDGRKHSNALVHRVSWEMHFGPIPKGKHVCHRCDRRDCVRPDHLFLGTTQTNVADMVNKGRHIRGETSPVAKLTEAQVRLIRHLHVAGASMYGLGKMFDVGATTIGYIIKRRTWKHV